MRGAFVASDRQIAASSKKWCCPGNALYKELVQFDIKFAKMGDSWSRRGKVGKQVASRMNPGKELDLREKSSVEKAGIFPPEAPIAVVGMACHLPGASSVSEVWNLLQADENAVLEGVPVSGVGRVGELFPNAGIQSEA